MKSIICVALLLIAAVCFVSADQHCLDKQFTASIMLMDPKKHYDDFHKVYYDAALQQQRIDIHELDPQDKHVQIYLKHNIGKMYVYDESTRTCTSHPLQGKLPAFCLANNATKVDQITIGGSLKADVWEEKVFGWNTRLILAANTYIPINVLTKGGHLDNAIFEEWIDFTNNVPNPAVFNLPTPCLNMQDNKRGFDEVNGNLIEQVNRLNAPFSKNL
nr:unnamed protein product [Naegleria fowleri]